MFAADHARVRVFVVPVVAFLHICLEAGIEACDDGNTTNNDACTNLCTLAGCGDNIVQAGEECDDGNGVNTDACTNTCKIAKCGDGIVQAGVEQCDDANTSNADGCVAGCKSAKCGDGYVNAAVEACDDGNAVPADGCQPTTCEFTPVEIAVGGWYTCARFSNGAVKCWGYGLEAALGLGDNGDRGWDPAQMGKNLPTVNLGTGKTAKKLAAGAGHNCVILNDDTLKCWGANYYGELGQGHKNHLGDGPNEMGDLLPVVDLGTGQKAMALGLGTSSSCVVTSAGSVKCWGRNDDGQLGAGTTAARGDQPGEMGNNLPNVSLGGGFGLADTVVGMNGSFCARSQALQLLKCWGSNLYGQLGLGNGNNYGDGPNEMGMSLPYPNLGTNQTVSAMATQKAGAHTCVVLSPGASSRVKCWGLNEDGQLGLGDTMNRGISSGQMGDALPYVNLGTGKQAKAVAVGLSHSCALLTDNTVKCWGNNDYGQLGYLNITKKGTQPSDMGDNLPVVNLGSGKQVASISAGFYHTCALLTEGTIKCWGRNQFGQLGLGDTESRGDGPLEMGLNLPIVDLW